MNSIRSSKKYISIPLTSLQTFLCTPQLQFFLKYFSYFTTKMIKAENALKMLKLWNDPKQNLLVNPIPKINLCALFIFFYIWSKYKKKKVDLDEESWCESEHSWWTSHHAKQIITWHFSVREYFKIRIILSKILSPEKQILQCAALLGIIGTKNRP